MANDAMGTLEIGNAAYDVVDTKAARNVFNGLILASVLPKTFTFENKKNYLMVVRPYGTNGPVSEVYAAYLLCAMNDAVKMVELAHGSAVNNASYITDRVTYTCSGLTMTIRKVEGATDPYHVMTIVEL